MPLSRRLLAVGLLIVLAALFALDAGAWTRTQVERGPFAVEAGTSTVFVPVKDAPWGRCCLSARSDSNDRPLQSSLRVWVDGTEYPESHTAHAAIGSGKIGAFSHWGDSVRVALPNGQANDGSATVRMVYPIQMRSRALSLALIGATVLALCGSLLPALRGGTRRGLAFGQAVGTATLASFDGLGPVFAVPLRAIGGLFTRSLLVIALQWAILLTAVVLGLSAVSAGLYTALSLVAWAKGWALASTAPILWSSTFRALAVAEPHGAEVVLCLALVGTLTAWFAALCRVDQSESERRLMMLLGWVVAPGRFFGSVHRRVAAVQRRRGLLS